MMKIKVLSVLLKCKKDSGILLPDIICVVIGFQSELRKGFRSAWFIYNTVFNTKILDVLSYLQFLSCCKKKFPSICVWELIEFHHFYWRFSKDLYIFSVVVVLKYLFLIENKVLPKIKPVELNSVWNVCIRCYPVKWRRNIFIK